MLIRCLYRWQDQHISGAYRQANRENERNRRQFERDRRQLRVSILGGRIYSEVENRDTLQIVRGLQLGVGPLPSMTESTAVQMASVLLQRSPPNIRNLLRRFETGGVTALQPRKTTRGFAHPRYQSRVLRLFTADSERIIRALIAARALACKCTGTKEILAELAAKQRIYPGRFRLQKYLRTLKDLPYGTVKRAPLSFGDTSTRIRERIFLIEYARELQRELKGDTILVYTDESFLHQNHCNRRSYYDRSSWIGRRIAAGGKGRRLIVLHAMTRFGLVVKSGHSPPAPIPITGKPVFTAELVYEGADAEDYHKTMNADMYELWLKQQLMPTLMARFPGKRIVLVIDGASYHRAAPLSSAATTDEKSRAKPKVKSKGELIDELRHMGVINPDHKTPLTVARGGQLHAIPYNQIDMRAPTGPYVQELALLVRAYKRALPAMNVSRASDLLAAWSDAEKRTGKDCHRVLYTPPGASECQPIEKLWAKTKNVVAAQYYRNRSIDSARTQLMAAFDACDSDFCDRLVEHAHKKMNELIQFQPLLSGTIGALQYDIAKSDADVVAYVHDFILHPPPKRRRCTTNDDSGDSSSDGEVEPESAPQQSLALLSGLASLVALPAIATSDHPSASLNRK